MKTAVVRFRGFLDILPAVFAYGNMVLFWVKYSAGVLGAKNNDSLSEKLAIVKFYTMEYRKCGKSNSKNDSTPPKLYQSGHAIWNADLPMPLYTFLEEYDFSGKTIIPFTTHGGSGFSRTIQTISDLTAE